MVQIITDSSCLYTEEEGKKIGIISIPLCVSIGAENFRDLEIPVAQFIDEIKSGKIPFSSQPPIGDVAAAYQRCTGMKIINLCMADGLSGTYQTACSAREMAENKEDITVINTKTLCGPHRYLVEYAAKMAREGKEAQEIVRVIKEKMKYSKSYLVPQDFDFLQRGGRLSPAFARIGSLLNLKPIVTLNEERSRLDKFGVGRTMKGAAKTVFRQMKKDNVGKDDILFISHGGVPDDARQIKELAQKEFPETEIQVYLLSHAFITQGGPGCIAIQYIRK